MKTIYISQKSADAQRLGDKFPNAGPYPCIRGMKEIWGGRLGWKDVLCIRTAKYLYHVDKKTYKANGGIIYEEI